MHKTEHQKYLVLKASGGGGLGDSIKSLLTAILYAHIADRTLVVDWRGGVYANGVDNVFDLLFRIDGLPSSSQIPDSGDVFPEKWRGRLHQSLDDVYHQDGWLQWDRARTIELYSFDLARIDYQQEVLVIWEFDQLEKLFGRLDSVAQNQLAYQRYAFQNFVRFVPDFTQQLDKMLNTFSDNTFGVHVRATDEFAINKNAVSVKSYLKSVDKALAKNSFDKMFLATDNQDVQTLFQQRYPHVMVTKKWFSEPGESLHLNPDCPDKIAGLRAALLDIMLLANCKTILMNKASSFAQVATICSSINTEDILSPDAGWHKLRMIKKALAKRLIKRG